MKKLNERLDDLRERIQEDAFLSRKGLSNEVGIHIFCYDASDEMMVQHFIDQITTDNSLSCRIVEYNLYQSVLDICEDMGITEAVFEMEEDDGQAAVINEFEKNIELVKESVDRIRSVPLQKGDILLITGVGNAFPFIRVHSFLSTIQPYVSDIPIVVLYPGKYTGRYVQLFGRLKPKDYYRAFNLN